MAKKAPTKKPASRKRSKASRSKRAAPKAPVERPQKKRSALDAAAQVLATANEPMSAKELIAAMAAKHLWTSPGGKTPHATLVSALIREIRVKGKEARFRKAERGRFGANI